MGKWGLRGGAVVLAQSATLMGLGAAPACFHDGGQVESGGAAQSSGGAETGPSTAGGSTGAASGGTGELTSGGTGELTSGGATTDEPPPPVGLDILFVVDNSSSMADEQALLVKRATALFDATAGRDVRVGVTTTDMGNPRCTGPVGTPELGALVRSSCVDRVELGEFTFNMSTYGFACTDACGLKDAELAVKPTATAVDPELKPRPWIERIGGVSNLPDGVSLAQAFQCFAPQGVAGCGLESPLEAARAALTASSDPASPQHGFLRDDADLVVVLVTDEMDCSYAPAGADIFTTNKVYWNDPNDVGPTSAVCFRAGAQCVGAGPVYESCAAIDKDAAGGVTMDPALAVLRPIGHYTAFFQSLEAAKTGGARVFLRAIAGVPLGYEGGGVPLVFQDSADELVQKEFGIGFGCEQGATTRAIPPLRILEVAQALPGSRIYSICEPDYTATMAGLAAP